MRFFYNISAIIVFICIIYISYENRGTTLNFEVFNATFPSVSFSLCLSAFFILGGIFAFLAVLGLGRAYKVRSREYEKKLTETSIDSSKDKAKIRSLERKIQTLEKALKSKTE